MISKISEKQLPEISEKNFYFYFKFVKNAKKFHTLTKLSHLLLGFIILAPKLIWELISKD